MEKNDNLALEICEIQYALVENITSISEGSTAFHRNVLFSSGTWEDMYGTPGSMKFEETQRVVSAGVVYDQVLTLKYPGEDTDNLSDLDDIVNQPAVLKITYTDGSEKLMGSLINPSKLKRKLQVGGGYQFEISSECYEPAMWYE